MILGYDTYVENCGIYNNFEMNKVNSTQNLIAEIF